MGRTTPWPGLLGSAYLFPSIQPKFLAGYGRSWTWGRVMGLHVLPHVATLKKFPFLPFTLLACLTGLLRPRPGLTCRVCQGPGSDPNSSHFSHLLCELSWMGVTFPSHCFLKFPHLLCQLSLPPAVAPLCGEKVGEVRWGRALSLAPRLASS